MQVSELVDLARFLNTFVADQALISAYDQLIGAVNRAAQNQNPEDVAPKLAKLFELHDEAAKKVVSPAQARLLEDFGASTVLGAPAAKRIREIFEEHQAHPQGLTSALEQLKNDTNRMTSRATQFVTSLEPMLDEVMRDDLQENEGRLWLNFDEAVSVETIDGLETAAEAWKEVLHHFARMPGAVAGGRLLSISKHSPLEIELAASIRLLLPLAFGITWVLSRVEQVINIRMAAEDLKQKKIKSKIIADLHKEADLLRDKITKEAADAIKKEFDTDGEARNAANEGLKIVLKFIEGGGVLDIDVRKEEKTDEDGGEAPADTPRHALRQLGERIRKDIRLLPPPASDPTSEHPDGDEPQSDSDS